MSSSEFSLSFPLIFFLNYFWTRNEFYGVVPRNWYAIAVQNGSFYWCPTAANSHKSQSVESTNRTKAYSSFNFNHTLYLNSVAKHNKIAIALFYMNMSFSGNPLQRGLNKYPKETKMFLSNGIDTSMADHITSDSSHLDVERWYLFSKLDMQQSGSFQSNQNKKKILTAMKSPRTAA